MKHPECGHEIQYMHVEGTIHQTFPMRCLVCMEEWINAGVCAECGKPANKSYSQKIGDDTLYFCRKHWMDMIRPEKCERCGQFCSDLNYLETGEIPGGWSWDGPYPSEPIIEGLCLKCFQKAEEKLESSPPISPAAKTEVRPV